MQVNIIRALTAASLLLVAAVTATAATAATIDERLAPCLACHGETGQSLIPEVPSLGAQPVFFLSVQLLMFREKMRNLEPMTGMMQGWSDDDLRRAAAAIAKLPAPAHNPSAHDPSRAEKARALIQQNRCNFCHKQDFSGEENAPRLAGQREDFLLKALREYKNNSRRAYDPSMADALHPLTDADFQDLAHYLSRLR
ncbi:MAG: c-type cytochrome [Candidatus Binatia bacterium]